MPSDPTKTAPDWLPDVPPLYEGAFGKAWKYTLPADSDDWRLTVTLDANFLIFAPGAHLLWSWHAIMAVSLRDVEGQPPAHKRYPEATHEVMVWALDPGHAPPDPREWARPGDLHFLQPPDAVVQFHVVDDDQATEIVSLAAKACTSGHLVPDSDHDSAWQAAIATTAEHYRAGLHG